MTTGYSGKHATYVDARGRPMPMQIDSLNNPKLKYPKVDEMKANWLESARIAAEETLRLRQEVFDLTNRGEDDPATDHWKSKSAAYQIAMTRFRELVGPREFLALTDEHK